MEFTSKQQISIDIISKYLNGEIQTEDALKVLEIGERQFRRRVKAFREEGITSVLHGNKGKIPRNKTSELVSRKICNLYRYKYYDLTVAHFVEKLFEVEEITLIPSVTTIRKILRIEGLISNQTKSRKKCYRRRKRYAKEGVMVQIDGSHHHWLLKHKPICLTAAIDDATGKILGAKFTETETTFAAMDVAEEIFRKHGVFQMLYSDKAGIYHSGKRGGYSNMERAMRELGVVCVQANSPQAKGRVERLFRTLQGRLVQEMRLLGIRDIDRANDFLKDYLKKFNDKFGVEAEDGKSAYRELDVNIDLNEVLVMKDNRRVLSGNLLSYGGVQYLINSNELLERKYVEVRKYRNGETAFFVDGKKHEVEVFKKKRAA